MAQCLRYSNIEVVFVPLLNKLRKGDIGLPFVSPSDVSFSDHLAAIFHSSFLMAASGIYYLLAHNKLPPPLQVLCMGQPSATGDTLTLHMQFFILHVPILVCKPAFGLLSWVGQMLVNGLIVAPCQ